MDFYFFLKQWSCIFPDFFRVKICVAYWIIYIDAIFQIIKLLYLLFVAIVLKNVLFNIFRYLKIYKYF